MSLVDMHLLRTELESDEGFRSKRYKCPAGKWTIGIGHNLEGKRFAPDLWAAILKEHPHVWHPHLDDHTELSDDLVHRIFISDIDEAIDDLDGIWIGWRGLSENRKRALINMSFQMGGPRLAGFKKMWAALRAHYYDMAADEAVDSAWYKQTQYSRTYRVVTQLRNG